MDGLANVARQQQSQLNTQSAPIKLEVQVKPQEAPLKDISKADILQKIPDDDSEIKIDINSKEQIDRLVKELNDAMSPINTTLKFGVDADDIFYISVIDTDTNEMIRRFPAEKAVSFLSKMQEVTGILFDSKG
ncbi:MAG: flagellar protein FlaG [Campylobacterota bacterium]|nr:flagellar protein FlaG [Campylobacterota bacterium]